jgi:hypothetical protein
LKEIGEALGSQEAVKRPPGSFILRARYPASGLASGLDTGRTDWARFYSTYDFEPVIQDTGGSWVVMEKPA